MSRRAFSLIELLVVIAVIAILTAITIPIAASVRLAAYRNSDIGHMNTIRTALQLYRADQGGFPPALLGYATLYASTPGGYVKTDDGADPATDLSNIVPADQVQSYLFPKREDNVDVFKPSLLRVDSRKAFWGGNGAAPEDRVVWPQQATSSFTISGPTDPNCSKQAYGPTTTVKFQGSSNDAYYYRLSGYDVATVQIPGGKRNELRYTQFWTGWGLGAGGCALGSGSDDPRQLGYTDPPETTLITWNTFFRTYESGVPVQRPNDIALFLGGSARMFDSRGLNEKSWAVTP